MEAEYIKRSRYGLRFHACSFFLLALLVRLSGELHDLNYNNCLLEQFPTRLFLVLNLAHMPEYPFFPELLAEIGHRGPRETIHALWGATWALSCRGGTEALATQAIAAEALATEESLATEALAMHRSRWLQRYRQWRRNSRGNSAPCSSLALSRLAGPITTA